MKDSYGLDELIGEKRRGFPNSGISMILGHLRSRNIYVQRQRVRESLVRTDPAGSAMRWFNIKGVFTASGDLILSGTLMDYTALSVGDL